MDCQDLYANIRSLRRTMRKESGETNVPIDESSVQIGNLQ
jgi:hypothetical protein